MAEVKVAVDVAAGQETAGVGEGLRVEHGGEREREDVETCGDTGAGGEDGPGPRAAKQRGRLRVEAQGFITAALEQRGVACLRRASGLIEGGRVAEKFIKRLRGGGHGGVDRAYDDAGDVAPDG